LAAGFLSHIPNLFPYRKGDLRGDLSAGITVGVLLVPQGMAYAMIAGLPPIYGLYAALIPQLIYAFSGSSRFLSVAPVAMISLLIGAGVSRYAAPGSEEYIQLAVALALMVGALQLAFGLLRLGFLVNFLSRPVISGYTSAAAIIIALSQLRHLLGVDMPSSNLIPEIIRHAVRHVPDTHLLTLLVGLAGTLIIMLLRRINPGFPAAVMVVGLGIALVYLIGYEQTGLSIVGAVPSGLPGFAFPALSTTAAADLLSLAILISLVGFMESITVAQVVQSRKKTTGLSANRELIALGLSNMAGSLFHSFPVSGGFSRSAVNEQAGARSGLAAIIAAVTVALTLLFLTPLFYYLPNALLASVILVAVAGLIDWRYPLHLWSTDRRDFWMLLTAFLFTLLLGVQAGILTGMLLSVALVVHRTAYPHIARLGKLRDTDFYRNLDRFPEAVERADALVFRFDAQLFFANAQFFREQVVAMMRAKGPGLKVVVLNAQSINDLDSTAADVLMEIIGDCQKQGIAFYLTEVIGPVRDVLSRTGLVERIGADHFQMRIQDALDHFDRQAAPASPYARQANI
jgi:sulfate permease, SulP family